MHKVRTQKINLKKIRILTEKYFQIIMYFFCIPITYNNPIKAGFKQFISYFKKVQIRFLGINSVKNQLQSIKTELKAFLCISFFVTKFKALKDWQVNVNYI